jgi:hypothetical protein
MASRVFEHAQRATELFALTTRTVFAAPIAVGLSATALLVLPAQSREIYLAIVSDRDYLRGVLGLIGILWLSAALYAWNFKLVTERIDDLYPSHAHLNVDRRLKDVRGLKALICAVLPIAGLVLGLLRLLPDVWHAKLLIGNSAPELQHRLAFIPQDVVIVALIAGILGCLLLLALRTMRDLRLLDLSSWLVAAAVYLAPAALDRYELVQLSRTCGPLWTFALVGIAIIPTVRIILFFAQRIVFSAIVWMMLFLNQVLPPARLVWLILALTSGSLSVVLWRQDSAPGVDPDWNNPTSQTLSASDLGPQFARWLAARGIAAQGLDELGGTRTAQSHRKLPVFVVAAQGGGIYAASAAMTFLAAMQDRCSNFSRHVFAISAVSGGAIGSAVFQSLVSEHASRDDTCFPAPEAERLTPIVSRIATDDHISALVASTPYDWLVKSVFLPNWSIERAEALKTSISASYPSSIAVQKSPTALARKASTYWQPEATPPALILASTSVETGQRVAFSPMSLNRLGDGNIYAFQDLQVSLSPASAHALADLTLIDAAVTSARFPGVLPAWPITYASQVSTSGLGSGFRRLNFVDGGYADASGASTAAEIIAALRQYIESAKLTDKVSLHLILVTDNETTVDIASKDGTEFSDLIAPINTLLNVRQLLARSAVTRAIKELDDEIRMGSAVEMTIHKIELDHRIFPLPLGWMLSHTTNELIRIMLGAAEHCPAGMTTRATPLDTALNPELRALRPTLFDQIMLNNSCRQAEIVRRLAP